MFSLLTVLLLSTFGFIVQVKADNTNKAAINDDKWYTDNPYGYSCPMSTYGVNTETSIMHNGAPTWRIDPVSTNWGADHEPIPVNVGDHIIMSVWIKTGGSSPVDARGARMGTDWWTTSNPSGGYGYGWDRIGAANNYYEEQSGLWADGHDLDSNSFVNWGSDWTYLVWSFTVQSQYQSDGYQWAAGTWISASTGFYLFPWIQVCVAGYPTGAYTCYFSDFQFINYGSGSAPSSSPSPTPHPTATPTPTPTPLPSSSPYPTPTPTPEPIILPPHPHTGEVYIIPVDNSNTNANAVTFAGMDPTFGIELVLVASMIGGIFFVLVISVAKRGGHK